MPTITFATPSKLFVNTKFITSLMSILQQISKLGYDGIPNLTTGCSNISIGRSDMLSTWYYTSTHDDDRFMFVDSDHTFTIEDLALGMMMCDNNTIACGSYLNSTLKPTFIPMNLELFSKGECNLLKYGATGMMIISKGVCKSIIKYLLETEPLKTFVKISEHSQNVIPFFLERIIQNNGNNKIFNDPEDTMIMLGEDYSFCWLARQAGCNIKAYFSQTITHECPQLLKICPNEFSGLKQQRFFAEPPKQLEPFEKNFKSDIILPISSISTNKIFNIIYYLGKSRIKFSPQDKNLRGSEQAIKFLCQEWNKLGCNVSVYGNVEEGDFDNVKYFNIEKFDYLQTYDNIILWRDSGIIDIDKILAKNIIIDMHDALPRDFLNPQIFMKANKIFFKSEHHRNYYYNLKKSQCRIVPNGLKTYLFTKTDINAIRNPIRFSFTSDYNRGLYEVLSRLWSKLINIYPNAELHIYTGFDFMKEELKKHLEVLMTQKNVFDHGRVDEEVLAEERYKSTFLLYPCPNINVETDCITVRECAKAGCIPLCFNHGVMQERPVVKINGEPNTSFAYDNVLKTIECINEDQELKTLIQTELLESKTCDWQQVGKVWLQDMV